MSSKALTGWRRGFPEWENSPRIYREMLHHEVLTIIKPEEAAKGAMASFEA